MLYFSGRYSNIVESFEGGVSGTFSFKEGKEFVKFNFIKRDISDKISFLDRGKYFDLISPFDYGGIEYSNPLVLESFFKAFSVWCEENQIISLFIRFAPMYNFDFDIIEKFIEIKKINELIYIDLSHDFWKDYSRGRKSNINRIKKMDYKVQLVDIEDFYPLYIESMKRNKAHAYYFFDKEVLYSLVKENIARLYGIYIEDKLVSTIMIFDDIDKSYYFLGGAITNKLVLDANAMLFHEVALILKEEGKTMFFLGGGRDGVYNFKQRFSKKTVPYYIGYKVYNTKIYNELINLTQRFGNQFFPQYREKII
ncbi:MAG: hypothetical protein ACNI25_16450 [Halarcobacter sp.]